jgi:hypothetical protein
VHCVLLLAHTTASSNQTESIFLLQLEKVYSSLQRICQDLERFQSSTEEIKNLDVEIKQLKNDLAGLRNDKSSGFVRAKALLLQHGSKFKANQIRHEEALACIKDIEQSINSLHDRINGFGLIGPELNSWRRFVELFALYTQCLAGMMRPMLRQDFCLRWSWLDAWLRSKDDVNFEEMKLEFQAKAQGIHVNRDALLKQLHVWREWLLSRQQQFSQIRLADEVPEVHWTTQFSSVFASFHTDEVWEVSVHLSTMSVLAELGARLIGLIRELGCGEPMVTPSDSLAEKRYGGAVLLNSTALFCPIQFQEVRLIVVAFASFFANIESMISHLLNESYF